MFLLPFFLREQMETTQTETTYIEDQIGIEEVNRILEVGRLLFDVLTEEEISELREKLTSQNSIGNAGVT